MKNAILEIKVGEQLLKVSPLEINVKVRERFYSQKEKWGRKLKTEKVGLNDKQLAYIDSSQLKKDRDKLDQDSLPEVDMYMAIVRKQRLILLKHYYNVASLMTNAQLPKFNDPALWSSVSDKTLAEAETILFELMDNGGKANA